MQLADLLFLQMVHGIFEKYQSTRYQMRLVAINKMEQDKKESFPDLNDKTCRHDSIF